MSNYFGGTWGAGKALNDALTDDDVTIEEAYAVLQGTQSNKLAGFWSEDQAKACREGAPMRDIDPALFPSSKGPRS